MFFKKCVFGSTSGMAKKAPTGLILLRKLLQTKYKKHVPKGTVERQKQVDSGGGLTLGIRGKIWICFSILRLLAWWPAAVSATRVAKTPTESVCPWGTDFGTTTATESEQGISENIVRKNKPEILCENSAYTSG